MNEEKIQFKKIVNDRDVCIIHLTQLSSPISIPYPFHDLKDPNSSKKVSQSANVGIIYPQEKVYKPMSASLMY